MTTLSGTLSLTRSIVTEAVEDPNTAPVNIVAGTAGSVSSGGSAMMGKADMTAQSGAFRSYGNGFTRLILGSGQTRTQTLALRTLTADQVTALEGLIGHLICYRDTYGRKVFGAFLDMTGTTIPHSGNLTDVAVVVQSVTYDEAV